MARYWSNFGSQGRLTWQERKELRERRREEREERRKQAEEERKAAQERREQEEREREEQAQQEQQQQQDNGSVNGNVITGTNGRDRLDGDNGDNVLYGKGGPDFMVSGGGKDTFVFKSVADFAVQGAQPAAGASWDDYDFVADFEVGKDKIDLSAIDANLHAGGNQDFTFIGNAHFSGRAGELRATSAGEVTGDVNGDGRADFYVLVREGWYDRTIELSQDDFIL